MDDGKLNPYQAPKIGSGWQKPESTGNPLLILATLLIICNAMTDPELNPYASPQADPAGSKVRSTSPRNPLTIPAVCLIVLARTWVSIIRRSLTTSLHHRRFQIPPRPCRLPDLQPTNHEGGLNRCTEAVRGNTPAPADRFKRELVDRLPLAGRPLTNHVIEFGRHVTHCILDGFQQSSTQSFWGHCDGIYC